MPNVISQTMGARDDLKMRIMITEYGWQLLIVARRLPLHDYKTNSKTPMIVSQVTQGERYGNR